MIARKGRRDEEGKDGEARKERMVRKGQREKDGGGKEGLFIRS